MEGQHSPALTWHTRNDSLTLSPHTHTRATPPTSQPHLSSAYTGTLTHLNQALHGPLPKDPAMFSVRVNWGRRSQRQSSRVLGGGGRGRVGGERPGYESSSAASALHHAPPRPGLFPYVRRGAVLWASLSPPAPCQMPLTAPAINRFSSTDDLPLCYPKLLQKQPVPSPQTPDRWWQVRGRNSERD